MTVYDDMESIQASIQLVFCGKVLNATKNVITLLLYATPKSNDGHLLNVCRFFITVIQFTLFIMKTPSLFDVKSNLRLEMAVTDSILFA